MQLIEHIKQHKSISIVGMAKNTGKTTCLNYTLKQLYNDKHKVAVTSIGVDGEDRDVLYDTPKPHITLYPGNIFATSEKHWNEKTVEAKVLNISKQQTALGRLFVAEAQSTGQAVLSGPSDTDSLAEFITNCQQLGAEHTLIDGALNRLSLASPAITEAMILCTGAAVSTDIRQLLMRVKYQTTLINLPLFNNKCPKDGVWGLTETKNWQPLATSLFTTQPEADTWPLQYKTIYISGALIESFLIRTLNSDNVNGLTIIVKDFSRIFTSNASFHKFIRRGGQIAVLTKANLIGICSNPTSPAGTNYIPAALKEVLAAELHLPVYDIMMEENKL